MPNVVKTVVMVIASLVLMWVVPVLLKRYVLDTESFVTLTDSFNQPIFIKNLRSIVSR